jgi:hypothetical protein
MQRIESASLEKVVWQMPAAVIVEASSGRSSSVTDGHSSGER